MRSTSLLAALVLLFAGASIAEAQSCPVFIKTPRLGSTFQLCPTGQWPPIYASHSGSVTFWALGHEVAPRLVNEFSCGNWISFPPSKCWMVGDPWLAAYSVNSAPDGPITDQGCLTLKVPDDPSLIGTTFVAQAVVGHGGPGIVHGNCPSFSQVWAFSDPIRAIIRP